MYVEASNRAEGGPNALATESLNAIRDRADLAPVTTTNMEAFEKAVWAERYYELNFENKMWFDMLRTRQVCNDITKEWEPFVGHTNLFGKTFSVNQLLFPIPQREADNNRNLEQNPGF